MKFLSKGLTAIFIICIVSAMAFAAWKLFIQDDTTTKVTSIGEELLVLQTNFADADLDTTVSSATAYDSMTFNNADGVLSANLNVNKTYVDNTSDTCNPVGDCIMTINFNGVEINTTESVVTVQSGLNVFNTSVECVRMACPADYNIGVILETI